MKTKNVDKHQIDLTTEVVARFPNGIDKINLTDNYIKSRIKGKIDEGKCVEEVWIREGEHLSLIFKNTNDQPK